jgi:hypothetical protein
MRIDVKKIIEHDDGSASLTLDLDSTALNYLVQVGFMKIVTDAADRELIDNSKPEPTNTPIRVHDAGVYDPYQRSKYHLDHKQFSPAGRIRSPKI